MPSHTPAERRKKKGPEPRLSSRDNADVNKALSGFIASERLAGRKVSTQDRVKIKTRFVNTIKKQKSKRSKRGK